MLKLNVVAIVFLVGMLCVANHYASGDKGNFLRKSYVFLIYIILLLILIKVTNTILYTNQMSAARSPTKGDVSNMKNLGSKY